MLHPVPREFDIKEPIKHKTFLINGKIGSWKGEYSEVKSTILSSKKKYSLQTDWIFTKNGRKTCFKSFGSC